MLNLAIKLSLYFLALGLVTNAGGESGGPVDLNRRAQSFSRQAQGLAQAGEEEAAFSRYTQALGFYAELTTQYPDWNPKGVEINQARIKEAAESLGARLYPLPEGYLYLRPDLSREGKRYQVGQALVGRVSPSGQDTFEVKGFTVELTVAGLRRGVRCNCPDFKYRGSKFGFPCKHIWAVLLREQGEADLGEDQ